MNPNGHFDQWHDQLPFYVSGSLAAAEQLALDEHLRTCTTCQAEVKAWQQIAAAVYADVVDRAAAPDLPLFTAAQIIASERKAPMFAEPVEVEKVIQPHPMQSPRVRSRSRQNSLGLGVSGLVILLIAALALSLFAPMLTNSHQNFLGGIAPASATVTSMPVRGIMPSDCPPSPLAMTVMPNVGLAVGAYPLWAVTGSGSAALAFNNSSAYVGNGWAINVLWLVHLEYQGIIQIHGTNLKTNAPLFFDPFQGNQQVTTLDILSSQLTPNTPRLVAFPRKIYVPEAGCYSLTMDWAGGSWQITVPAGQVSAAMQTATASAIPTLTATPSPTPSPTPSSTALPAILCAPGPIGLSSVFEATETALPPLPTLMDGQTPPPPRRLAPVPFYQLRRPGCPSPTPNLIASPIPVCSTTVPPGASPTPSSTPSTLGGITLDCLPLGMNIYTQVCPDTVPLSQTLLFRAVIGPPFPPCDVPTSTAGAISVAATVLPMPACSGPGVAIRSLFEATETALPPVPTLMAGQTAAPPRTLAPLPVSPMKALDCVPPTHDPALSPIPPVPICLTNIAPNLRPTPSPTTVAAGGFNVDCLPPGMAVYIQVCPNTVPLSSSLLFRTIIGPPFPSCDDPTPTVIAPFNPTSTVMPYATSTSLASTPTVIAS